MSVFNRPVVLSEQFTFDAAPAAVRAAFDDVAAIIGCIPGATVTGQNPDGSWAAVIGVQYGETGVRFDGTVQPMTQSPDEIVVAASGRDGKGTINATGEIRLGLAAAGTGTAVALTASFGFTGILAPLARSATKFVGPRMLQSFGKCLASRVSAG